MAIFRNGEPWLDTDGNVIHAHGGHMFFWEGYYYWYGENRNEENYVSCYRTKDFTSFEFRGNIITASTPAEPTRVRSDLRLTGKLEEGQDPSQHPLSVDTLIKDGNVRLHKVNLERPKVLYCAYTKKFVLWAHYENGLDYHCAACAVATSDYPDHGFVYHGSFNPFGDMARDCTLWQEPDGRAYFIAASRDNAELHVWKLSKDYLNTDKLVNSLWQGEYREAPAVFYKDGRYFMLSSYCTGWAPNQGKWSSADALDGEWDLLRNFGDDTTFRSQPAFVLPLTKDGKTRYLYVGDRWGGRGKYNESTYIVLEIQFDENGAPFIVWNDEAAF